jgi:predicted TIM-barrel fold metal-dependent hydrolase
MIDAKFVIDAVAHAFDCRPQNLKSGLYARRAVESFFQSQRRVSPERYQMSASQYFRAHTAEELASALFLESLTDVAVYHSIPAWGIFNDLSPIGVGMEIRERYPRRMLLYGAVSPLEGTQAIEALHRQVESWRICGLKLYPIDIIDGRLRSYRLNDEDLVYPLLARCLDLGINNVAIHKAIPLGTAPMEPFRTDDIDYVAADFPGINFEIVHGGFAFLEETAWQVARFDNVFVNMETSAQLIIKRPQLFASFLGELLLAGGGTRLYWGTGAMAYHPAPFLEAFAAFEMPEALRESHGYPAVTEDIKADILCNNFARAHHLDVGELSAALTDDEVAVARRAGLAEPWSRAEDQTSEATSVGG